MRLALPLALASLFTACALPVQAAPGVGVNLLRINGAGVKPLPGLELATTTPAAAANPSALVSQAVAGFDTVKLGSRSQALTIRFSTPLPANLQGVILIRREGEGSPIVERIAADSARLTIAPDRLSISIQPETPLDPNVTYRVDLSQLNGNLPPLASSDRFLYSQAAAGGGGGAGTAVIVVLVLAGVGLGIAAVSGAFGGGNGGGGNVGGGVSR